MEKGQPTDFITVFIDKFAFVEAKKYLALKGPLGMNIVHDSMYPLLTFSHSITIFRPPEGIPRRGKISVFWHQDTVHPCLVTKVFPDGSFKVVFINKEEPARLFPKEAFLGEVSDPKISWWWKFKLKKLCS